MDHTSEGSPRRKSLLKKVGIGVGGVVVLLVVLVALLPTFINWGFLRGTINGEISGSVNGTVTIDGLEVSWGGPLKVKKLAIDDAEHHSSMDATVVIDQGLWTLLMNGTSKITGSVEGNVKTRQESDGSLAIAKMFKSAPASESGVSSKSDAAGASGSKGPLPAGMDLQLAIGPLALVVDAADGSPLLAVSNVNGQVQMVAGSKANVKLGGDAKYLDYRGNFNIDAKADGLVAQDGSLVFRGTPVDIQAEARKLQFASAGLDVAIEEAAIAITSKDPTDSVDIGVLAKGRVNASASNLDVALTVAHPLTADGKVAVDLGGIKGTVKGEGLPTAPLQLFVESTPLVLTRDVGPTVDINAAFADATGKGIKLSVKSERLKVSVEGGADPATGAATLSSISAEADVDPALAAVAGVKVTGPSKVTLNASDVVVPGRGADGAFPKDKLEFRATLAAAFRDAAVSSGGVDRPLGVSALQVSANAKPVEKGVDFTLSATPTAPRGGTAVASTMRAQGKLVPGGRFGVHGNVEAAAIPTALIDPWMPEGFPIRLVDDVGPVINGLNITADEAQQTALAVMLDSAGLKASIKGTQGANGSLTIDEATIAAPSVRPELLARAGVHVADAVSVQVRAIDVSVPAGGAAALDTMAGTVTATIGPARGEAIVMQLGTPEAGAAPRTAHLRTTKVTLITKALGTEAAFGVDTTVDGAMVSLGCKAKELLNSKGEWLLETASLDVTVKANPVTAAQLAQEIPAAAEIIRNIGGSPYALDATFAGTLANGDLGVILTGAQVTLKGQGKLRPETLTVDADLSLTATPALLSAAAADMPFRLMQPALVTAKLTTMKLPRTGTWGMGAPQQMSFALSAAQLRVDQISGIARPVKLHDIEAGATLALGDAPSLQGTLKMGVQAITQAGPALSVATGDLAFGWKGGQASTWNLDAKIGSINGPGLDELLGMAAESRGKFGTGGEAHVKAQQAAEGIIAFEATSKIDQFNATVKGDLNDGVLTLQPSDVKVNLPGPQVVALLNGANEGAKRSWTDAEPLVIDAVVKSLRMRVHASAATRASEAGGSAKDATAPVVGGGAAAGDKPSIVLPSGFSAVVDVTTKPLTLTPANGAPVRVQAVTFSASAPGISQPATIKGNMSLNMLAGRSGAPAAGAGGSAAISVDGTLRDWAKPDGSVSFDTMQVDANVVVDHASSSVVGVLLGLGSELEEAVGPQITATVRATSTGPGAGMITASVDSEFLTLQAPRVALDKGFVIVAQDKPLVVRFQPSPPLRDRLLEPINPVFTDVSLADPKKPMELEVSALRFPLDNDMRKLDADLQLRVGAVNLQRNPDNQLLNMLKVWQSAENKPVDGLIEPLTVAVRSGQLKYDKFNILIEKQGNTWVTKLIFSGDIDLTRTPPMARAIAANYPMGSLARSVLSALPADEGGAEVQGIFNTVSLGALDMVQLRISFSGPLGDVNGKPVPLKRKVKVDFKPDAVGKGVGEVIKDAGDILKDIFDKKKK